MIENALPYGWSPWDSDSSRSPLHSGAEVRRDVECRLTCHRRVST